ncbi:MAG: cytidine deaminase [Actinomycetota bacterium]|nr:cytidine deaminase [Actinomycetota bacterium]
MTEDEFQAEDAKLVTLARATRSRTGAAQGAAVRDTDGRTYAAATVALPSLQLSALQVAVALALSSGAPGLEAAVVLAGQPADAAGAAAVAEVSASAPVYFVDERGERVS